MKKIARKFSLLAFAILLTLVALPGIASADEGDGGFVQTVNGYHVALIFGNPVTVGENQFHIQVSDAHDMPVPNANLATSVFRAVSEHIESESSHDTHGGTSGQSTHTATSTHDGMGMTALRPGHESGEYAGEIVIDQAGEFILRAHINIDGEPMQVDFPLTAAQVITGSGILMGFAAVNAVILVVAGVVKPKPASA